MQKMNFGQIVFIVVSCLACNSQKSALIGQWKSADLERVASLNPVVEFFEDGTFLLNERGSTMGGKWTVLDDGRVKIEVDGFGGTSIWLGRMENRELTLDHGYRVSRWVRSDAQGSE